jgi:hypothetical protein
LSHFPPLHRLVRLGVDVELVVVVFLKLLILFYSHHLSFCLFDWFVWTSIR